MIASSSTKFCSHILKSVMSNGAEFFKRIDCWKDTKERAKNYPTPISEKISNPPTIKSHQNSKRTAILIQNMDSIDCGLYWKSKGFNPVVLNLADDCFPGVGIASQVSILDQEHKKNRYIVVQTCVKRSI